MCARRFPTGKTFYQLFEHLHGIEFVPYLVRDRDRAADGMRLRDRFADEFGIDDCDLAYLNGPCSVLEMMIALSIRCEETIMDDPAIGDRTAQWFWGMLANLGISNMHDRQYDVYIVSDAIERFLENKYEPDGRGGLFTIRNCEYDLRTVSIWDQLCWYTGTI